MRSAFRLMVPVASLLFVACSTTLPPSSLVPFVEAQQSAAEAAEEAGDLASALTYWRTLALLAPDDTAIAARIGSLEAEIDTRVARALERGVAAYARDDRRAGDRAMLQALALRPGLEEALTPLRESASAASHERQAEKVASEFTERAVVEEDRALDELERAYATGDFERVLALGESEALIDRDAARVLTRLALIALADRARRDGDVDEELRQLAAAIALASEDDALDSELIARDRALRVSLSKEAYRDGLAVMQADLPAAIASFERAVAYDPENLAAREKLSQALKIKANLDRIRGG